MALLMSRWAAVSRAHAPGFEAQHIRAHLAVLLGKLHKLISCGCWRGPSYLQYDGGPAVHLPDALHTTPRAFRLNPGQGCSDRG